MRYINEDKFVIEVECTECGKKHSVPLCDAGKQGDIYILDPAITCVCGRTHTEIQTANEQKDSYVKSGNEYNINDAQTSIMIRCPNCGSSDVFVKSGGFGWGKAFLGALFIMPFSRFLGLAAGLIAGFSGSSRVKVICKSCNAQWKMSKFNL